MPNQPDTSDDSALVAHLERLATDLVAAINRRDISLTSPDWQCVSPEFTAGTNDTNFSLDLQQTLAALTVMTAEHPEHKIMLLDMNTNIKRKTGHAEVFMNVKMNNPGGLTFSDVGVLDFSITSTGWRLDRYRGITGTGHIAAGL